MMDEHGLSTHHFGLLVALGENGWLAQQDLGRIMGVDPRNAVPIIDELETRKLIARQSDPQDRRRCNIKLTPPGRRIIRRLRSAGSELERKMLEPLSATERTSLHRLLLKLLVGMQE